MVQADERKEVALAIAAAHPVCVGIVDKVRVNPPGEVPDDEVAQNARAALDTLTNSVRQATKLSVSAGVATLRGTLPTEWERAVAEDVVLGAPGVRQVTSEVKVIGAYVVPAPRSDPRAPSSTHAPVARRS
jgi:osmotically-inducible protein OsmY